MLCSAAEIAEKRRIAQEKLKAKKESLQNQPKPSSTVQSSAAIPANKFYSTNGSKAESLRAVQQNKSQLNHLKETRTNSHPYSKVQGKSEPQKLAPVFVGAVKCECYLISDSRFAVQPSSYLSKLIDVFKTIPSKSYDNETKIWSFALKDYVEVQTKVGAMQPYVIINTIPQNALRICSQPVQELDFSCLRSLEPKLQESLLTFQKEGVCFGISKHGRVLIADEMGLGKTYQALAIADFYRDDWPLLVCTSASTREAWATHIRTLLPYIACHHIACLVSNQDYFGDCKALVTSYAMMEKNVDKLLEKNFGVLIFDESHMLKSQKAKCTVMADRLARQARRVILLSGTPALSRPVELFTQLAMIDRNFFTFKDYTTRYCAAKQTTFGWDASGQSNLQELKVILSKKFMIRRIKADVLPQLAEKLRETVILDPQLIWVNNDTKENLDNYAKTFSQCQGKRKEEILLKYYSETAAAKSRAVCSYIKGLLKEKSKFLVFAHHQVMMDAISKCLNEAKADFIRIDGSTRSDIREELVKRFQTKKGCKVALLSLKACNTGITLTEANVVVFAELDWNPSTLAQAESRAHRIGQSGSVTCRYLLANKTADDVIWQMLKNKQDVLNKAGLFCEDLQDGQHVSGPRSTPDIKKYFTPKKVETVPRAFHEQQSPISSRIDKSDEPDNISKCSAELQHLLSEDEDEFAALKF